MTNDELKKHISAFVRDYSIEITPHDTGKLDAIRAELTPGTAVYVAHPPGVPIDDIVTLAGYESTVRQIDETIGLRNVPVWHCNDAKAAFGSKLDRHQHIGQGTIGAAAFKRVLNDPRLAQAAFIAETPIDKPGDDRRNVEMLKSLVHRSRSQNSQ